jgi:hypothetical protein
VRAGGHRLARSVGGRAERAQIGVLTILWELSELHACLNAARPRRYADLLDHTNAIAKRASVVLDVAGTGLVAPPGADANAFWEGRPGKTR